MIAHAIRAEFAKLRHARAVFWTFVCVFAYVLLIVAVAPQVSGPEAEAKLAASGEMWRKAVEAGIYANTWKAGLHQLPMSMGSGLALVLFTFVTAYIFGSEYKQKTMVTTLAAPVRREYVVLAKMLVLGVWIAGLTVAMFLAHVGGIVALGGAPGFAWSYVLGGLREGLSVTLMIYLTLPLTAWLAIWGGGYLRPMLGGTAAMMIGNSIAATAVSPYWPWNMPLHAYGASWMPIPPRPFEPASWVVAIAVFAAGLALTMWQLNRADVVR